MDLRNDKLDQEVKTWEYDHDCMLDAYRETHAEIIEWMKKYDKLGAAEKAHQQEVKAWEERHNSTWKKHWNAAVENVKLKRQKIYRYQELRNVRFKLDAAEQKLQQEVKRWEEKYDRMSSAFEAQVTELMKQENSRGQELQNAKNKLGAAEQKLDQARMQCLSEKARADGLVNMMADFYKGQGN